MTQRRNMLIALTMVTPVAAVVGSNSALAVVQQGTSECVAVPGAGEGDVAVVNLTPTRAAGAGYGALRPLGAKPVYDRPADEQYSSVNFAANTPANPNLALVTTGPGGGICYDAGVADHDVLIDVAAVIPAASINAVDPTRLVDTRDGNTQVGTGTSLCLEVPSASPGDVAVINVTPTRAAGTGFGSLRSQGTTPIYDRPAADQYSSVNFAAATPANPNLSFVTVGTSSEVCYDGGGAFHDVILDLSAVLPADAVIAAEPRRLFDSRDRTPIEPGATACFPIEEASPGDVVVVNITPTSAQGTGFGAMLAGGEAPVTERPVAEQFSSVNFAANTPVNPNLAVVTVSDSGFICYNGAVAAHHVILDVATIIKAGSINATSPERLGDTRAPAGSIPIEVDVTFLEGSPVSDVYPEYPQFGVGVAHNGHTENPFGNRRDGHIEVGTVRGYIVDNGDGTISGRGFIEDRWGRASGSSVSTVPGSDELVENYSYYYEGFAVQCPESPIATPPGLYVFESNVPVTFSGTTETLGHPLFGFETYYQISMSAGVGAQPGVAGAVPEIEVVVDTLDECAAGYEACADVVSTQPCGEAGLETADLVLANRDDYVLEHLRINEVLVENFVIDTPERFISVAEDTNFQVPAANNDQVRLSVRLGS